MKKLISKILLIAIALNLFSLPSNAYGKQESLHGIFGDSVYICSSDNSFELEISEFEKLLYQSYENNLHEKYFPIEFNLSSNLGVQKTQEFFVENNFYNSSFEKLESFYLKSNPRSPPQYLL